MRNEKLKPLLAGVAIGAAVTLSIGAGTDTFEAVWAGINQVNQKVENEHQWGVARGSRIDANEAAIADLRSVVDQLPSVAPRWSFAELGERDRLWETARSAAVSWCNDNGRAQTWAAMSPNFDLTGLPSTAPDNWMWEGLMEISPSRHQRPSTRVSAGCAYSAQWVGPPEVLRHFAVCARPGTATSLGYAVHEFAPGATWRDHHGDDWNAECPDRDVDVSYQITTPALPAPATTTAAP